MQSIYQRVNLPLQVIFLINYSRLTSAQGSLCLPPLNDSYWIFFLSEDKTGLVQFKMHYNMIFFSMFFTLLSNELADIDIFSRHIWRYLITSMKAFLLLLKMSKATTLFLKFAKTWYLLSLVSKKNIRKFQTSYI